MDPIELNCSSEHLNNEHWDDSKQVTEIQEEI